MEEIMKPYETMEDEATIEIIAYDRSKPDMLVWRCTEEQGNNWEEIISRVKSQGYSNFEKRKIDVRHEFYSIND